jgi:DNA repair protein RAD5
MFVHISFCMCVCISNINNEMEIAEEEEADIFETEGGFALYNHEQQPPSRLLRCLDDKVLAMGEQLKPQQLRAMHWLQQREAVEHDGCKGGLIFDEPGTGKTLQTCTLIALQAICQTLPSDRHTLVLCPSEDICDVWRREIKTRLQPGILACFVYHGSNRYERWTKFVEENGFDSDHIIILATYGVLTSEYRKAQTLVKGIANMAERTKRLEEILHDDPSYVLFRHHHRIVLDEAHAMRNKGTRLAHSISNLRSDIRWALTASPIFNSLDDLLSLLVFVRLKPYAEDQGIFQQDIVEVSRKDKGAMLRRLHAVLAPITIRRSSKRLQLPPVEYTEVVLQPSLSQKAFCEALFGYCGVRVRQLLRQAAEHKRHMERGKQQRRRQNNKRNFNMSILTLITYMREAVCHPALVVRSMKRLKINTDDVEEEADEQQQQVMTAHHLESAISRLKELTTDEGRENECCVCMDAEASVIATPCNHRLCGDCWGKIQGYSTYGAVKCPICRADVEDTTSSAEDRMDELNSELERVRAGSGGQEEEVWNDSAKIDFVIAEITKYWQDEKIVIVSQWVRLLKIIQERILAENICPSSEDAIIRLQGDVPSKIRTDSISRFQTDDSVRICLLSLNSSSEGITLTKASRMYIMDPWWNPSRDYQAMHRLHRIGQTRPVKIFAIYLGGTIEDRIRTMRASKGAIAMAAVGDAALPDDMDWADQARFFFSMNDDKCKPVPKCYLPGIQSNVKFGNDYGKRVREEKLIMDEKRAKKRARRQHRRPPQPPPPQPQLLSTSEMADTEIIDLTDNHPLFGSLFV